jgi:hypothetical protein
MQDNRCVNLRLALLLSLVASIANAPQLSLAKSRSLTGTPFALPARRFGLWDLMHQRPIGLSALQSATLAIERHSGFASSWPGGLDLERVACACPTGTEGTPRCNYGRSCGVLRARGQDVGAVLIAEGLARVMCAVAGPVLSGKHGARLLSDPLNVAHAEASNRGPNIVVRWCDGEMAWLGRLLLNVRFAPIATEFAHCIEMTLSANRVLTRRSKKPLDHFVSDPSHATSSSFAIT